MSSARDSHEQAAAPGQHDARDAPAPRQREPAPILGHTPSWEGEVPLLGAPTAKGGTSPVDAVAALRRFHHGACAAGDRDRLMGVGPGVLPALLSRFHGKPEAPADYPLFLPADPALVDGRLCLPVADVLDEAVRRVRSRGEGTTDPEAVLGDAVPRLVSCLHASPVVEPGPAAADARLQVAGRLVERELDADQRAGWGSTFDAILGEIPEGSLLAFDEQTAVFLLGAAARHRVAHRRTRFRDEVRALHARLGACLAADDGKADAARDPGSLDRGLGTAAGTHIDTDALASALGHYRGSERMSAARRARISAALEVLASFSAAEAGPVMTLVRPYGVDEGTCAADASDWSASEHPDPCAAAVEIFDREAARLVEVFRAVRLARLEIDGSYDEEWHGPWLAAMSWQSLTGDELLLVPPVVALETAERLAVGRLPSLTRLLVSGRPVQVLVTQHPVHNPTAGPVAGVGPAGEAATHARADALEGVDADPVQEGLLADFRLELAYLGIGHRQAMVQQSTAARPDHLAEGFARSLEVPRASLHVLASGLDAGGNVPPDGSWLHVRAAIEARAHPLFRYDPDAGSTWARRLEFDGNPQPAAAWPVYPLEYRRSAAASATAPQEGREETRETVELAFTFADFALLEPAYRGHFCTVPEGVPDEALIPLAEHLELPGDEATRRVPNVWGVQSDGRAHRLAVTRELVLSCRDRASFWRTLQELAGVHNEYVELAQRHTRTAARSVAHAERIALQAEHRAALAGARQKAVSEAMYGLAESLLTLDPEAFARKLATAEPVVAASIADGSAAAPLEKRAVAEAVAGVTAATPPAEAAAPAPTPARGSPAEGPWVETALCTSCDDCVKINRFVFVHDENKQIVIGDPGAGTFAQIVKAAEKCPAKCIHPGEPLNPDERGLDKLRRRAAPFNV